MGPCVILFAAAVAATGAGCSRPRVAPQPGAPVLPGEGGQTGVVARVGGVPISQADVARQMRFAGSSPRAALDDLIRFELLAAAAAPLVPRDDADVLDARARAAVQRLIERDIEPRLGKDAVPEAVLREVYEKARSAFVHPRLVEVAMLNVYTGARMKEAPRAKAAVVARELEAYLRHRPQTVADFEAIAQDATWKDRRVKFSRVWQGIDEPFPAEVGRAVQQLARPGQTTAMVAAETGFHVARYIGERPPKNVSFPQARDELREQIFERWRTGRFLELTAELAGGHVIEAYPDRLSAAPP